MGLGNFFSFQNFVFLKLSPLEECGAYRFNQSPVSGKKKKKKTKTAKTECLVELR